MHRTPPRKRQVVKKPKKLPRVPNTLNKRACRQRDHHRQRLVQIHKRKLERKRQRRALSLYRIMQVRLQCLSTPLLKKLVRNRRNLLRPCRQPSRPSPRAITIIRLTLHKPPNPHRQSSRNRVKVRPHLPQINRRSRRQYSQHQRSKQVAHRLPKRSRQRKQTPCRVRRPPQALILIRSSRPPLGRKIKILHQRYSSLQPRLQVHQMAPQYPRPQLQQLQLRHQQTRASKPVPRPPRNQAQLAQPRILAKQNSRLPALPAASQPPHRWSHLARIKIRMLRSLTSC